jgi:glycosyltransferase involved in cell wall biosynthesis
MDIIKKYDPWISFWVSEPDRGQAHAINKGFQKATGDLVGWINSDDMLLPGALQKLAQTHAQNPAMLIAGDVLNYSQTTGRMVRIRQKNINLPNMIAPVLSSMTWHQPGIYVPGRFCKGKFLVDESMRYFFDQDWLCKILQETGLVYLSEPVAVFRLHASSKTVSENHTWVPEQETVTKRYWDLLPSVNKPKILAFFKIASASIFLGKKQWNRRKGTATLIRIDPDLSASCLFQ